LHRIVGADWHRSGTAVSVHHRAASAGRFACPKGIRIGSGVSEVQLAFVINAMGILPRDPYKFPFDIIGLAAVSKAFALAKACINLLRSDLPDEAFGLSRSIVECANNLRYMTEKRDAQDQRVRDYVNQYKADKAFWAHYCLELFAGRPEEEKDIREYMEQEGITPDTKPASNHWSGERGFIWKTMTKEHPLDGPVTEKHKKISHAADYFQTSTFVHCSLPAIDNHAVEEGRPFKVSTTSGRGVSPVAP